MKKVFNLKSLMSARKGFTLIELLIVIAVLGILAAVVLVAIDPVEQLNRGRDSGRKTSVGQVGRALQAYYTQQGVFPTLTNWDVDLVTTGEIRAFPSNPAPVTAPGCGTGDLVNNYCYKVDAGTLQAVVYTHLVAKTEINKTGCVGAQANTWYVYSTLAGRAGTVCEATEANITPNAALTFL